MPHPRQYSQPRRPPFAQQPAGGVSTPAGLSHRLVLSGDLRTCEHLGPCVLTAVGRPACLQFCHI